MLFTQLQLGTAHMQDLSDFYGRNLGFGCDFSEDRFSVKAGKTNLVFTPCQEDCYYHFAFNIASNKIQSCLKWLTLRSEVVPYQGRSVVHFDNWNAEAVYTLDPGGNIVEFIARQDMPASDTVGFDPKQDVFSVSEIGCPVENISGFRDAIAQANIPIYSGSLRYFCALGDPQGLFIVVDGDKKTWMPTEVEAKAFPFNTRFTQHDKVFQLEFGNRTVCTPLDH